MTGIVKGLFGGGPKALGPDPAIAQAQEKQRLKLESQEAEQRKQKTSLATLATGATGRARQTLGAGGRRGVTATKLGTQT